MSYTTTPVSVYAIPEGANIQVCPDDGIPDSHWQVLPAGRYAAEFVDGRIDGRLAFTLTPLDWRGPDNKWPRWLAPIGALDDLPSETYHRVSFFLTPLDHRAVQMAIAVASNSCLCSRSRKPAVLATLCREWLHSHGITESEGPVNGDCTEVRP